MKYKAIEDVRTEILNKYTEFLPNLDLTEGTPERDMFVEAPLEGFISPLWNYSTYVAKLHAPHIYYYEIDDVDINNYIDTYQITPVGATYSTGTCTFYTYNQPTKDIIIGTGTVVTTTTNPPVEFVTTVTGVLYYETHLSYYSVSRERWEITLSIRAQKPGAAYRAGKNTIIRMASNINGIEGCYNDSTVMGGAEAESKENKLRKVIKKFQGRDNSSTSGVESFIKNLSPTANVVWANSPLMLRDGGLGGAIDIYLIDEDPVFTSETISITSEGLSLPINVNYTTSYIKFSNQPISTLISLIRNGTIVDSSKYELTKDTGLLKKSTRSSDKLTLIPTNGYHSWGFLKPVTGSSPTGLTSTLNYGFRLIVDGGVTQEILIAGSTSLTIETLCPMIEYFATGVTCVFDEYKLEIIIKSTTSGEGSSVLIIDGGATGQDANLFSSITNASLSPVDLYAGEEILPFTSGDTLEVTYMYNAALLSVESALNTEAVHYHGRDYLAREMDSVQINLVARFKEVAGQDFLSVKSSVESAFISLIETNKIQNVIELADVITTINQVSGVSNLDISYMSLTASIDGVVVPEMKVGTDIYSGNNQYMESGNITLTRWSS